jgi:organic hydroperoxide reductase OsmC/OhrA
MKDDGQGGATVSLAREEGFRFRIRCGTNGAATIITDEPPPLGAGKGPNPTALLAAAVGNCLASSLLFCMQKARLEVRDFEAEVSTSMVRDPDGRLRIGGISVCLAPTVSPEDRERMGRCLELFESFCTVTQSVRRGIDVTVAVEPRVDTAAGVRPQSVARLPCVPVRVS